MDGRAPGNEPTPAAGGRTGTGSALEDCRRTLRDIQQVARVGIWRYETATGELWWSDELYAIFGIESGGATVTLPRLFALVHPEDRAAFQAQVASREPHRSDYRIVRPDGAVRHIHEEVEVELDGLGIPVRMQGTAQDVTDRAQIEERLRESESRYRAIIDSQAEFVVRYQAGGVVTFVNETLCRYVGLGREELLGRSYYAFMHPEDRAGFVAQIEALDRDTPAMVAEARVVLPDGRVATHRWNHHAIFDERGRLVEYQATGRDVTEGRQAEAQLLESERRYRALFEAVVDGVLVVDLDGRIVDANPVAYTRLGYAREEFLGLNVRALNAPEYAARVPERFREIRERGSAIFESVHRRKDGSLMPVEVNSRLFDLGGQSVYFSVVRDITERRRAEEELAAQRATLQQILDTSSVAIFLVDRAGRLTSANRCMGEMFGRPAAALVGEEYVALVHPAERDEGRRRMLALLASAIPSVDLERRYLRADGTVFWGHLTGRRFVDARGVELGLLGVITDVTERRQAEEALRKNERMLQAVIDAEPECVKLLDADGGLIFMNRAGLDMIQADSLDQVKGQCVCPMIGDAHREAFMDLTRRVFRGEAGDLLFEMTGLHGRRLWLETHAVPLRDERDEIVALLGVTRDVTDRRLAEEALRSSEARFRSIIEGASVGILVADVESGRFRYANPEICRMLGFAPGEFASLAVRDLAVPEEREDSRAGFRAHVEGRLRVTERTFRRKDGGTLRVSVSSVPVEFDGRACLVGFIADITERRLLEEERLRAQKLESIGTLAGGIAHDFNNLLQGVFGYLSMAKLSLDRREKALAMLEQAEKALHQSVNLTTQLLTFSKGGKPARKPTDLRPVVENAVKFALSGSRVTYDLAFGEDLLTAEADEGQIGQVIQNIVLNAEQAMPLGGRIQISVRNAPPSRAAELSLPAANGLVEIVVRDEGTGIPAAHLPRIFDPYFTTKEKGSGLGLATSYSIVRNHEGAISVRSEPGKGTTFTVDLPAAADAAAGGPPGAARPTCAACRVLVMDDEEIVRAVAGELLQTLGHEAAFAEEGAAALARYAAARDAGRPFDVVILDLTIRGGMGGEETLRRLRELDPAVKAVVSSGYSDDEVAASFREHGFRAFLKKPYSIGELNRALAEALG